MPTMLEVNQTKVSGGETWIITANRGLLTQRQPCLQASNNSGHTLPDFRTKWFMEFIGEDEDKRDAVERAGW